ncbi:hypothetical protein, partial [Thermomonas sp.]|uniref:hypothetical protein n=1 Tax=Thermomonas sp. TaxID=1971895 RepID=UPI003782D9A3
MTTRSCSGLILDMSNLDKWLITGEKPGDFSSLAMRVPNPGTKTSRNRDGQEMGWTTPLSRVATRKSGKLPAGALRAGR